MRKLRVFFAALLLIFISRPACAELASIHAGELPQESSVLAALDDAKQLESYSSSWSAKWKYPISKGEVATRLGKDLEFLKISLKAHPQNVELLLLTGLVAHYSYNVDVPDTEEVVLSAFKEVVALAPADVRGPWFQASFLCQTTQLSSGIDELLSIESGRPWEQFPAGFWNDYMQCAEIAGMPAHVLRAADHLAKLHAPETEARTFYEDVSSKRFDAVDMTKDYDPKLAWYSAKMGADEEYTGTGCGLRIRVHEDWNVQRLSLVNGSCVALFGTGPYKANSGKLSPSILILVQRPKEGQTLKDFQMLFANPEKYKSEPDANLTCPVPGCLANKMMQTGAYGKNGDQQGRLVVFERAEPEFPGLIFESPNPPPATEPSPGLHYFHPSQMLKRMPGKLYYAVALDVAALIEEPALKDFVFTLQNLKVE